MVLPDWLADTALDPVWAALRPRLERRGAQVRGRVRLDGLERDSRHALAGVLGRDLPAGSVHLDLADLETSLRERAGLDLPNVVAAATGTPLRDRPAERAAYENRRQAPLDRLADAVREDLAGAVWAHRWVADVRSTGLLTREPDALRLVDQAVDVLVDVLEGGLRPATLRAEPPARRVRSRSELAARHAFDAHALDEGRPLHALVLRALVAALDLPEVPARARDRRDLWERAGVPSDRVSATCLLLGIGAAGESPPAQWLRSAAENGDPVHLTRRDLARLDLTLRPGRAVLVCENPTVLEALAESLRARRAESPVAAVCTSGWPSLVCLDVLTHLRALGARLRYHGDFDWPGIEIANHVLAETDARPWRMGTDDYRSALPPRDGLPLTGRPVTAVWDPALSAAMTARGAAVHEEAVLDELLGALEELAGE